MVHCPDLDTRVMSALQVARERRKVPWPCSPVSPVSFSFSGSPARPQAQLPFPLPGEPSPDMSKRPQCTKDYVKSIEQQIATLDKFRSAGPEAVGQALLADRAGERLAGRRIAGQHAQTAQGHARGRRRSALHQDPMPCRARQSRSRTDDPAGLSQIRVGALQRHDLARKGVIRPSTSIAPRASRPRMASPPMLMVASICTPA